MPAVNWLLRHIRRFTFFSPSVGLETQSKLEQRFGMAKTLGMGFAQWFPVRYFKGALS
jgi:hypothetical protein